MRHFVTLTMQQIRHMRLLIRLQRIRAIKVTLEGYATRGLHQNQAIGSLLQREDYLANTDIVLMFAESQASQGLQVYTFGLDENLLAAFSALIEFPYSTAQVPHGTQAEQAQVLKTIEAEREGLKLAMATANQHPPAITMKADQAKN